MASIFISREIDHNKWTAVLGENHNVVGQSLISFSPMYFDMPSTNWVFFYSQKGVKYFFEQSHGQLAPYKWAAIGPKTASLLSEYVLDIDFIGNGVPIDTAKLFATNVELHETICFVRAKYSKQSIQKLMPVLYQTESVVVYANEISNQVPSDAFDVLIFTSPLNAESYFSKRTLADEKVIAIGGTTAQMLEDLGIPEVITPKVPKEDAIIELILDLI